MTITFVFILLLVGCEQGNDFTDEEALEYLKQRYGCDFELISVERINRSHRYYVDERMAPVPTESILSDDDDDIIYTFRDENGLESHMCKILHNGYPTVYYINDEDYATQYLMSKPKLYEKLTNSSFTCEYVNPLGIDDAVNFTGFELSIKCYDEIADAVAFVHEVISQQSELLPDKDCNKDLRNRFYSVYPRISIQTEDGAFGLVIIPFLTEKDSEISNVEELTKKAEREYVNLVRNGQISETLPNEVLENIPTEKIQNITFQGEIVLDAMYYNPDWGCYFLWDNGKSASGNDYGIYYKKLSKLLEKLGYTTDLREDSISWSNDENCVIIEHEDNVFTCTKNGKVYEYKGEISQIANVLKLTEHDLEFLFGITFEFNQIEATGEIILLP